MHDERVVRRPALGRVDALDGGAARGVRAEAVDGFRGEGDGRVAGPEVGRCGLEGGDGGVVGGGREDVPFFEPGGGW